MSKLAQCIYRIITMTAILILLACAGAKKEPSPYAPEGPAAPSNLIVETSNGTMNLSWTTNRSPDMLISGYNIYVSDNPLGSLKGIEPFNLTVYPGDDNPDITTETFTAQNLKNGVTYYVAVTIVYPDRAESGPSNIVKAVCYPRGSAVLNDRSMSEPHGFDFSGEKYVDYNAIDNDLYFIARDIGNMIGSPDRNEGMLRHTEFAELPGEKVLTDRQDYRNLAFKDRTYVAEGNIYLLKLATGGYAKIKVKQVDSSQYKKQIVFDYIYLEP